MDAETKAAARAKVGPCPPVWVPNTCMERLLCAKSLDDRRDREVSCGIGISQPAVTSAGAPTLGWPWSFLPRAGGAYLLRPWPTRHPLTCSSST